MGWGDCGTDSQGRPIGYSFEAICDHLNCKEKIDRGLSYVCGEMHGEDEYSCEKYFCEMHKNNWILMDDERTTLVCDECAKDLLESGEFIVDEEEGYIRRV